jgi:drug/metabolite transporter (DMT)-like permease
VSLQKALLVGFGVLGIVWYYVCLFNVGQNPGQPETTFRTFMSLSITTISVSLATFVGLILGLQTVSEQYKQRASALTEAHGEIAQVAADASTAANRGPVIADMAERANQLEGVAQRTVPSYMQWGAALMYLLSLIIAMYFWWKNPDNADPAIANLAKSILGLIGGSLSVLLNIPRP